MSEGLRSTTFVTMTAAFFSLTSRVFANFFTRAFTISLLPYRGLRAPFVAHTKLFNSDKRAPDIGSGHAEIKGPSRNLLLKKDFKGVVTTRKVTRGQPAPGTKVTPEQWMNLKNGRISNFFFSFIFYRLSFLLSKMVSMTQRLFCAT